MCFFWSWPGLSAVLCLANTFDKPSCMGRNGFSPEPTSTSHPNPQRSGPSPGVMRAHSSPPTQQNGTTESKLKRPTHGAVRFERGSPFWDSAHRAELPDPKSSEFWLLGVLFAVRPSQLLDGTHDGVWARSHSSSTVFTSIWVLTSNALVPRSNLI